MNSSPHEVPGRADGKHEEVGRISTTTIIFILVVIALLVYELQFILLPFLLSGLVAYIFTPVVNRLAARTRISRSFFAVLLFAILVSIAVLAAFLGLRPLLREFARALADLQTTIGSLAQAAIGDRSVKVFGEPMNAAQLAQAAVSALREWIGQPGKMLLIGEIAFSTMFGFFLSVVLLFYFLYSGPRVMRGLLWLVPPAQRPLILDIWSKLDPVLRRYFIGVFVVVAYAATAAYVGLGVVLHIPHAVSRPADGLPRNDTSRRARRFRPDCGPCCGSLCDRHRTDHRIRDLRHGATALDRPVARTLGARSRGAPASSRDYLLLYRRRHAVRHTRRRHGRAGRS